MSGLGFIFIFIYILKGWMAKYTSNVTDDVSSTRPDHSGHPMVAKKSGQCPFYPKTKLNFKSFQLQNTSPTLLVT